MSHLLFVYVLCWTACSISEVPCGAMGKGYQTKDIEFPSTILSCFQCSNSITPVHTDRILTVDDNIMRVVDKNLAAVPVLQTAKRRIDTTSTAPQRRPCQDITNITAVLCSPPKKAKNIPMTVTSKEMTAFFKILGE